MFVFRSRRRVFAGAALLSTTLLVGLGCSDDDSPTMMDPPTTGRLSGAVLDNQTGAPIAGAPVSVMAAGARLGGVVTSPTGLFELDGVPAGLVEINIDARNIFPIPGNTDIHYPQFNLHANAVAGASVPIDFPVFLPRIDESQATPVDGVNPTAVMPPTIPGLRMDVDAGGATFPDGGNVGSISIVDIPIDRAPMSMPAGMAPRRLISIQPAGTSFDPPASIEFPNDENMPPDTEMDILSMDPVDGEFRVAARGRVSTDGSMVEMLPGTGDGGITAASWHAPICDEHTVTGRVVDPTFQMPLAGVIVEVLSGFNSSDGSPQVVPGGRATTGADGVYTITGVRVCNVRIRATLTTSGGAGSTEVEGPQADADGTTEVPDIELAIMKGIVGYDIAGQVTFADGTAVAGAFVQAYAGFGQPRGFVTTTADAFGNYLLEGMVSDPGEPFFVFAGSKTEQAFGEEEGTAPMLADNGTTVTIDIVACRFEDFVASCPVANWELDGNVITLSSAIDVPCNENQLEGSATLIALNNGVLDLNIADEPVLAGDGNAQLTRVKGSGPTGISEANLVGVYRQTLPEFDTGFIQISSDGTLGQIEGIENGTSLGGSYFTDYEAGTYTLVGTTLNVTPLYSSDGVPDPPSSGTASANATTLTVNFKGEMEVFTRCEATTGTSIVGTWFMMDGSEDYVTAVLLLGTEEYAVGNMDVPVRIEEVRRSMMSWLDD